MSACTESERFAACLRSLKERSGLSYAALAAKAGTSGSSVHRYCLGSSVPQDYGTVHRLAVACGASPEELRTLHRFWAVADAARDPGPTDPGPTGPGPMDQERTGPERTGPERTEPTTSPEPELALLEPVIGPPEPSHGSGAVGRRRRRIRAGIAVGLAVLFLGGMAWNLPSLGSAEGSEGGPGQVAGERPKEDARPLFTSGCREVVAMGQHDTCVREVQRLLHAKGAVIGVDGDFGPQTLRRVTAFQVLAGIDPPNGVVGDSTKRALYRSGARMDTWT
ncbi:helix-turn-helix domain-containing protein [Streptomyces sp. NBC_00391]|uniref:helix-turn-helix domain-containing protein n=1 Tax=Streptomyces sp. NBC_00391 TaxID=2903647 RepID=UPI002E1FF287